MMRLRSKAFEQKFEEFTAPCGDPDDWWSNLPFASTGATGDGYKMAKKKSRAYHHTALSTESPLISEEPFIKERTCKASLYKILLYLFWILQEKPLSLIPWISCSRHFGLSGPAALRCSSFVNQELKSHTPVPVMLDCFPEKKTASELVNELTVAAHSKKKLVNALSGILPERLLEFFIHRLALF